MKVNCLSCGEELDIEMNFDTLLEIRECPKCKTKLKICYDEIYNEDTGEEGWFFLKKERVFIDCIGVDDKKHLCEPHENICKCGVNVKSKKIDKTDSLKLSCYECSF